MGTIKYCPRLGKPIASERLGWGVPRWSGETQYPVRVFRALVCLRCVSCHAWIKPGELFVRRIREDASGVDLHRALPTCRVCYPFDCAEATAEKEGLF